MTELVLPDASDLDTEGTRPDYKVDLYLIPAAENGGTAEVVTHTGVGNIGWPEPAFHNRWMSIGGYGANVFGGSVRQFLEKHADLLTSIAATYEGSEWDGHNHTGRWTPPYDDTDFLRDGLADSISHYWDCADWLSGAGSTWVDLCRDAEVDVERDDADAVETIAQILVSEALTDGVLLSNVEPCIVDLRNEWREEQN